MKTHNCIGVAAVGGLLGVLVPVQANAQSSSIKIVGTDHHAVDIDKLVPSKDVAAIEVYTRQSGMPDAPMKSFEGCGVLMIWTKR